MDTLNDNRAHLRIAATFALTTGILLAGCDRPPENDLEQWVKANAVQPFDRIEVTRKGGPDSIPLHWSMKRNGDRYQVSLANADKLAQWLTSLEAEQAHDTRFLPLDRISGVAAKQLNSGLKQLGLAGTGHAYLMLSRAPCVAASFSKHATKELNQLGEQAKAKNEGLREWTDLVFTINYLPAASGVFECDSVGLAPAYQASLVYIEGERGVWLPPSELAPHSTVLHKMLTENAIDSCGFSPDDSAVPAWVRSACKGRQYAKFEAIDGIGGSRGGILGDEQGYWFYTQAGLVHFMDAVSWTVTTENKGEAAKLIVDVHTTGGAQ